MNKIQIARICATVKPLALLLLATACGGAEDPQGGFTDNTPQGGAAPVTAGAAGMAAASAGSTAQAGAIGGGDATPGGSGGAGGTDAAGADAGGKAQGGGTTEGGASAGQPAGGTSSAGAGGVAQAGAGGSKATDPLEPVPVPGCPGYVKVFVPHGTCVWLHGSFTTQSTGCGIPNPPVEKCATASAVSSDITGIVSVDAEITRFDFDQTGCPHKCN